jgi:vanillate O-demethylase ferredoxin subunit
MKTLVRTITLEAQDILSFELAEPAGGDLPPFAAGAHIDVHVPGGFLRQFSLCNDPAERHRYVTAVLREPAGRGGSRAMHERVRVGDTLEISAPRSNFPLAEGAGRHLLIAGGIGITPLLAMVRRLARLGADFTLHYCTRSTERTAFRAALAEAERAGRVRYHHDGGDPRRGLDVGALLAPVEPATHVYCCGPAGLMAAVKAATAHWPTPQVHFEYFAPPSPDAAIAGGAAFEVAIRSTGKVYPIAADRSILATLREAGLVLDSSCESGTCGTCKTRYLAGEPEHRDYVLSGEEQRDHVMICVSRAKGRLVLDL